MTKVSLVFHDERRGVRFGLACLILLVSLCILDALATFISGQIFYYLGVAFEMLLLPTFFLMCIIAVCYTADYPQTLWAKILKRTLKYAIIIFVGFIVLGVLEALLSTLVRDPLLVIGVSALLRCLLWIGMLYLAVNALSEESKATRSTSLRVVKLIAIIFAVALVVGVPLLEYVALSSAINSLMAFDASSDMALIDLMTSGGVNPPLFSLLRLISWWCFSVACVWAFSPQQYQPLPDEAIEGNQKKKRTFSLAK